MVKLIWDNKKTSEEFKPLPNFDDYFSEILLKKNQISSEIDINTSNMLFWDDNLQVLKYLILNFKQKIDLIYIDPPFFSGTNYSVKIEQDGETYDSIAYHDHWSKDLDSYLQMLYERIVLFKELLSEKGLLFVHLDWHASHYIRVMLDEIFGENQFVNSIVWYYYNKYSAGKQNIPRAHDDILLYSKTQNYSLNQIRIPRDKTIKQLKRVMVNGVLKNAKDENGHVIYRNVSDKKLDDVWKIPCMQPASKEWTGFPTQKHYELLERILLLGSNEGDLIADFFCGSGTTLLTAEKLNRRWIGCDISKFAIYLTRKRIMSYQQKLSNRKEHGNKFRIFGHLTDEKLLTINSGFFEKNIKFKRH